MHYLIEVVHFIVSASVVDSVSKAMKYTYLCQSRSEYICRNNGLFVNITYDVTNSINSGGATNLLYMSQTAMVGNSILWVEGKLSYTMLTALLLKSLWY